MPIDPIQSWLDAKEVRRMAESLMAPAPEVNKAALDAGYGDEFEGFAEAESGAHAAPTPMAEVTAPRVSTNETQLSAEITSGADHVIGTSAKMIVSHSLADAKRLAEGSGMLSSAASVSPAAPDVDLPDTDLNAETAGEVPVTPWDQSPDDDVPLGQQISPPPVPPPPTFTSSAVSSGGARGPFLNRLKKFSSLLRERTEAKAMFLIDNDGQILIDEVGNTKLIQVARTLANASNAAERQTAGAADVGNLHVKIGASATLEVIPCLSRYGLLILGVVCPAPMGAELVTRVADYLAETIEPSKQD